MNAATTRFVLGPKEGPASKLKKGEEPTHFYLVDDSKADDDAGKIAKFSLSQLYSYSEHAWKGLRWAQSCGYKAVPRQIINNLKDAKALFTGQEDIYKGKSDKTEVEGYQKTVVTVLSPEEFDALFTEFDAEVNESVKMDDYEKDTERDSKNRDLAIGVFRKLLNSEERVSNLMKLMAGVMHGGFYANKGLWSTYRGFFQFIISGMVEDYKNRTEKRKEDPEAGLEFPHLNHAAFAQAIHAASINLTVDNTVDKGNNKRRGSNASFHKRTLSNGEKTDMDYATLPHMLKWFLVLGLIEQTFTPAVFEKLSKTKGRAFSWCTYNIGSFIRVFGFESLGKFEKPKPKDHKKVAKKGVKVVATAAAAAAPAAAEKPADEEAVADDSEDDESEDEEAAPAAVEKEESDEEEADDDDDDEEEEDSDDEPDAPAAEKDEEDSDDEE